MNEEVEEKLSDGEDMHIHHSIKVDPGQEQIRIDKYLVNKIEGTSRNRIQNSCDDGMVKVNDKPVKSNYKIKPGDTIEVFMNRPQSEGFKVIPEDIPLDIIYEDEHLMVINKPAGLVVHPGSGNPSGTLVNGILHYLKESLPVMEGNTPDRPGIVHRIDKNTSGLMVIAKTDDAVTGLGRQFYDHSIKREYIALVWGDMEDEKGTITGNIGRHPLYRLQMHVFEDEYEGKHAVTHYEVLKNFYYVSLVKCTLETGRTHQIRVHMKSINHPLFNDDRYGGDKVIKGTVFTKYKRFVENCFDIMPHHALHAATLGFIHPVTKEAMEFNQPLPDNFQEVIERWQNYLSSRKGKLS